MNKISKQEIIELLSIDKSSNLYHLLRLNKCNVYELRSDFKHLYLNFNYNNYYSIFHNQKIIQYLKENKKLELKEYEYVMKKLLSYHRFFVNIKISLHSMYNIQITFNSVERINFFKFNIKLFELDSLLNEKLIRNRFL